MTEKQKHRAIVLGSVAGGVVLLWWLWQQWGAAGAVQQPVTTAPGPQVPASTPIGWPSNTYNLSFQEPNILTAPPLGVYVPLFGFIGIGREWAY